MAVRQFFFGTSGVESAEKYAARYEGAAIEPGSVQGHEGLFVTTHQGQVVQTGEHNWYNDSDFYAIVWNGEKAEKIEYGTTRCWTYGNSASVDASPETQEAYRANQAAIQAELRAIKAAEAAAEAAAAPSKGKSVIVVKGRKVAKGTEGQVFWYGETAYGFRVGIVTEAGEKVFTAADNVAVTSLEVAA